MFEVVILDFQCIGMGWFQDQRTGVGRIGLQNHGSETISGNNIFYDDAASPDVFIDDLGVMLLIRILVPLKKKPA